MLHGGGVERFGGANSPCIQKSGPQDHDGFTRALLQLHLDGAELAVDDAHHPLYLLR